MIVILLFLTLHFSLLLIAHLALQRTTNMNGKEAKHCSLCFHNGEPEDFYSSHNLKTRDGKIVTCPVLRKFVCNICGATGDVAHTIRYCPFNKDGAFSSGASLPQLKTRRNAAGNFSSRRMVCHPLPSTCWAQDAAQVEVRKRELEASKVREVHQARQPVAMRTFVSKSSPPGTAGHFSTANVGASSGYNPYSGGHSYAPRPRGGLQAAGSRAMANNVHNHVWLSTKKVDPGVDQFYHRNFYPCNTSVGSGLFANNFQAGWGFSALESKVEDVGKLLEELRMGTTAVEGW